MPVHRSHAEDQLGGDGLVRGARGELAEDLDLAVCQAVGVGRAARHERVEAREVGGGAKLREDGSRGLQLEEGRVLVPELATGPPDQFTGAPAS